ncbi:MAG: hypothetical protein A4E63_01602 [Syntrophorhabdus sp. PtaU1.Bin050]|nr:MAG: hypothetical protein A4E63_01602 [Syntrophorhabdus sp. PtaU1.Bin050]
MLDFDISGADSEISNQVIETIGSFIGNGMEEELKARRVRQSDKGQVFKYVKEWLSERIQEPIPPKTEIDWVSLGESFFWVGRFNLSWLLLDWLHNIPFDKAIDGLPVSILADVVYGLSVGCPSFFEEWMTHNRSEIIRRLRQQGRIMAIEDDDKKVTAHFIVGFEPSGEFGPAIQERINASTDRFHEETIIRINLMRKLLPDRQLFASQGYGHRIIPEDTPWDSTQKTGIDKKNLSPTWLISVNSTFRGLAEKEFRPEAWSEYAEMIVSLRRNIADALQQVFCGLENYFPSREAQQIMGTYVNESNWYKCHSLLNHSPFLPKCTLDEWGFVDESMSKVGANEFKTRVAEKSLAISRRRPFLEALSEYSGNLSNFFTQAPGVMVLNPILGRGCHNETEREQVRKTAEEKGIKRNFGALSALNLGEVLKALPRMQMEFDRLLGPFIDETELKDLKHHEQKLYRELWDIWYVFVVQPEKYTQSIKSLTTWTHDTLAEMRRGLQRECRKLSDNRGTVRIVSERLSWVERPALWITVNSKDVFKPFEVLEKMVASLRKSMERVPDILRRQYVADFYWPTVVIVPLVQGKSLSGTAWKWSLLSILYNEELRWWQLAPQPVPQDALAKLNIALWDDPRLEPGERLLTSYGELTAYISHIADFLRLPQEMLDKQGTAILQEYLDGIKGSINRACQSLLDSISVIANAISESKERMENHPFLISTAQELAGLLGAILPSADSEKIFRLDLAGFGEWSKQLAKANEKIMKIYLSWISDMISNR